MHPESDQQSPSRRNVLSGIGLAAAAAAMPSCAIIATRFASPLSSAALVAMRRAQARKFPAEGSNLWRAR